jgi:hypothetical protein
MDPCQRPRVVLGEIRTALLASSVSLSPVAAGRVVRAVAGDPVRQSERPIPYVVSPETLTGIDCRLATYRPGKARGIGTAAAHVALTGGRVVQGSAWAGLAPSPAGRRLGWSYYLARPGTMFVVGRTDWPDLAHGFVESVRPGARPLPSFDPGGVAARLVAHVQRDPGLIGGPPLKTDGTTLRWAALLRESVAASSLRFAIAGRDTRTMLIDGPGLDLAGVLAFAEDVALHDWLLSALTRQLERGRLGIDDRRVVLARLAPAVDQLLHLWMPAARLDDAAAGLWRGLERRPGFGRHWDALVNRIRDQLALGTMAVLTDRTEESVG